eukprot:COSAG02_NODE_750_length_17669_cov_242.395595_6_plen_108_part_00
MPGRGRTARASAPATATVPAPAPAETEDAAGTVSGDGPAAEVAGVVPPPADGEDDAAAESTDGLSGLDLAQLMAAAQEAPTKSGNGRLDRPKALGFYFGLRVLTQSD